MVPNQRKWDPMLDRIKDLPPGLAGVRASGRVTSEDYERVMRPLLDDARREGQHLRFLYELTPDLEGFSIGAAWDEARLGMRYLRLFDGCAVVGDVEWIRDSTRLFSAFMPCPVRTFGTSEKGEATAWLESLPHHVGVKFHILPDASVLVVDVASALRAEDFDALSAAVDHWLETHGELRGIVVHAHEFPGWDNAAGFVHHLRFVRDHHRMIGKVALAAGGTMAGLVPRLAKHFVAATVKHFDFDAVDAAIAWARD